MDTGLQDHVAIVTGASGGIGREIAMALAAEGARVALHGHRQFEAMVEWLQDQSFAERAHCVRFDIRDRDAVFRGFAEVNERFGRIDVCAANAGMWPKEDTPLHAMDEARLRNTLDVNLFGNLFTAQAFVSQLERFGPREDHEGASLVFTGSTAGRFGERFHSDYSIAKAAFYGAVRSVKNEIVRVDPYARVNVVEPGWTATHMARPALAVDETVRHVVRTMALRQIAHARDIARAVTFFASPKLSRHVSGEALTVAGGMEGRLLWEGSEIDVEAVRSRIEQD
jgi:3-oxoacyl-[acyl-carrier protein] reductase